MELNELTPDQTLGKKAMQDPSDEVSLKFSVKFAVERRTPNRKDLSFLVDFKS